MPLIFLVKKELIITIIRYLDKAELNWIPISPTFLDGSVAGPYKQRKTILRVCVCSLQAPAILKENSDKEIT